jgi:alkaline phosphatase D
MAANVHAEPGKPDSPVVATEFLANSITSQGPSAFGLQRIVTGNPHIRYARSTERGYAVLDLDRKELQARLRTVETVKRNEVPVATAHTARVESGKPGLQ